MVSYSCLYSPFPEIHHVRNLMSTQLRTFRVCASNHPFKNKTVTVKMGIFLNFCSVEHKYIYIYIMTCIFQTKTVRQLLFFPPRSLWVQWKMVHSPDNWPYNGKKTTSWQCFLLWNMAIYNCHVSILEGMFQNTGRKHPFRETHEAPLNLSEQLLHGPCMPSSPSSDHPLLVLQL